MVEVSWRAFTHFFHLKSNYVRLVYKKHLIKIYSESESELESQDTRVTSESASESASESGSVSYSSVSSSDGTNSYDKLLFESFDTLFTSFIFFGGFCRRSLNSPSILHMILSRAKLVRRSLLSAFIENLSNKNLIFLIYVIKPT